MYGAAPGYGQPPNGYGQQGPPPGMAYGGYAAPPPQQAPPQPAQQQGMGPNDQAIQMWFNSIDTDRNGQLDAGEIQRALAMGSLNFNSTDVDSMVRAFDTRGQRRLNQQEFSRLHAFLTSIQTSFSYFDRDRSNSLRIEEVKSALQHAGFTLDEPVVRAMMNRHDPDNSKTMSLDEFIRMCLFLQSCVRTFSAFDPQRTGRITLDFGQFVYAAAHIC